MGVFKAGDIVRFKCYDNRYYLIVGENKTAYFRIPLSPESVKRDWILKTDENAYIKVG
jgi:hypothetical protein